MYFPKIFEFGVNDKPTYGRIGAMIDLSSTLRIEFLIASRSLLNEASSYMLKKC